MEDQSSVEMVWFVSKMLHSSYYNAEKKRNLCDLYGEMYLNVRISRQRLFQKEKKNCIYTLKANE